jgi:hypothetical protein
MAGAANSSLIHVASIIAMIAGIVPAPPQTTPACVQAGVVTEFCHGASFSTHSSVRKRSPTRQPLPFARRCRLRKNSNRLH